MSPSTVQQILKMIDALSDSDRELLEQQMSQKAEAEWRHEAEAARQQAKQRGIDQAVIDEAVRKHRYGS